MTPDKRTYYQPIVSISDKNMNGVATNNSVFVVVGTNTIAYSTTGYDNWTSATVPTLALTSTFYDVIYAEGVFVAVGINSANGAYICTSTDGITWTERVNGGASGLTSIAYNGTDFCACGANFAIGTSSNGTSWSVANVSGGSSFTLYNVSYSYALGQWIVCGDKLVSSTRFAQILKLESGTWNVKYNGNIPNSSLYGGVGTDQVGGYYYNYCVGTGGLKMFSFDGGDTWANDTSMPSTGTYYCVKNINNNLTFAGAPDANIYKYDINSVTLYESYPWYTTRLQALGSSPNSAYDNTVLPIQDRLTNNVLTTNTFRTGLYVAGTPTEFFLVAGDLQNPTTPSTVYAGRKSISLTEFKG
jgi:photosystem II stability/assembly factor-like uncharacterized protein